MKTRTSCFLALALAVVVTISSPAKAELELHLTFDDMMNLGADSSGKNRPAEVIDGDGIFDGEEFGWVDDPVRGGVLEAPGSNNGYLIAEIPQLPAEGFTITMWAQRSEDLCCGGGGANDGLFHITADGDPEIGPGGPVSKVIGGWVQKADAALWGRIITEDLTTINLDKESYVMDHEDWVHLAYRGNGEDFDVIIDGDEGSGPVIDYDGTIAEIDTAFIAKQGTETWGGLLDDFRIYSRALTIEEIREVMSGGPMGPPGDFDGSGVLDLADINMLTMESASGANNAGFDLNEDALVNFDDIAHWTITLANSWIGDSNLDGEFNSSDFVQVFQAGQYEDGVAANSAWETGDWNGDGEFDSTDFVVAFQDGGFEQGPKAPPAVPEPLSLVLLMLAMAGLSCVRRRRV